MPDRQLQDQFSIDWLDYHGRYDAKLIAAVDVDTGRSFTYREFNDRLRRLANGLRGHFNVRKGDRVALIAQNCTSVFECLFASWEVGAALMPLNWRLSPREISTLLDHGEPSVLIHDDEFCHLVADTRVPTLRRNPDAEDCDYESLIAACSH